MGSWPDPAPFEAEDGSVSASLDALIRGPGAALPGLLLLGDSAGERATVTRDAAIRLARAWVRTGRRVLLMDLEFDAPALHEHLGVANDQGVADHFAFGTSLPRLALPIDDGAWGFVPAGAWVEDPVAVLSAPAWPRLLRELAESDATLLAYAPAQAPGVPELARAIGAVVVLGSARELPGVRPFSVVAVLQPPSAVGRARGEAADAAYERIRLPTETTAREALIADLRHRQRAALMAPPDEPYRPSLAEQDAALPVRPLAAAEVAGVLSPEAAAIPAEPVVPAEQPERGGEQERMVAPSAGWLGEPPAPWRPLRVPPPRSRAPVWWTVAVIVLLSVLAGSWYFARRREARRLLEEEALADYEIPLRLPQAMPPTPAPDTVLGYVVAIESHVRLPNAQERLRLLRSRLPGAMFFIGPVFRDDALYYQVVAGPLADSAAAGELRDSLRARQEILTGSGGEVGRAPYAFLLGEYQTQDSADTRVNGLRRLEIPSYALPVAGPPARFRVYAGGYAGPEDAEVMRQILQSVGEPDVLVERVGKR